VIPADLDARVATAPGRTLRGWFWHQGPTGRDLTSFATPAVTPGRYHRLGGTGVWYASDQEQAAWAELFRHFTAEGVDPFEIRRRVGAVQVQVRVLDLTSAAVRDSIGVTEAELVDDDYRLTQALGEAAQQAGFLGILAPAAALQGGRTLVLFPAAFESGHVTAESSRIRQPPPRLADLLGAIRAHPDVPAAVRAALQLLAAAGSDAIRRLRRGRPRPAQE
jgi:RES domain-containing protein